MQIFRMLRGQIKSSEAGRFHPFLDELRTIMQPVILPAREAQAHQLGVDTEKLVWTPERRADPLRRESEGFLAAEVFVVDGGLLIVGLNRTSDRIKYIEGPDGRIVIADESEQSTIEIDAFVPVTAEVSSLFRSVSKVAKSNLGVGLKDYYFSNSAFESIRKEVVAEELPSGSAYIQAAKALADRPSRTLAISIKGSRGLLVKDLDKTINPRDSPALVEHLVSSGVALREVVVVCGMSQTQVARVPDKASLAKLAAHGLRCACGKPIDQESPEDLLTISDIGALLLDKSRWLSVLVREELMSLGVPAHDILLECQLGSDEVDCIALVSGELVIFELKDKEFSMGNAYSFSAKISVINPRHSIIVTTDKVATDVKDHFNRAKRDPRGIRRPVSSLDQAESIYYVEGDDFASDLKGIICKIYRSDARAALDRALRTGIPSATSVLNAITASGVAADQQSEVVSDAPTSAENEVS